MSRILNAKGVHILCSPCSFGGNITIDIIKTRGIENHLFTIMCNRAGIEFFNGKEEKFLGHSFIMDVNGKILAESFNDLESLVLIDIDVHQANIKSNIICQDFQTEWNMYQIK